MVGHRVQTQASDLNSDPHYLDNCPNDSLELQEQGAIKTSSLARGFSAGNGSGPQLLVWCQLAELAFILALHFFRNCEAVV